MSRTKFAVYNIFCNIGLQIVIAICGFIVPPLIIYTFGSEINGLVSTIKQLMNYFSVVSLGIGAATTAALYKPLSEKNFSKVSSIFSATRIFFNQTGYWFCTLVIFTAIFLPIFKSGNISKITIVLLVIILGLSTFIEYIVTVKYRLLLQADQKSYIGARISAEGSILNALAIIILVKLGASIVFVQLIASGMYLYRLLGLVYWIRKIFPQLDKYAKPDFNAISNRWHAFQYQLPDIIISYTPIIIIAAFCGYANASIYAVYNTIFAALFMIVGVFSVALAPTFGNIMAQENKQFLEQNFRMYDVFYRLILSICCISAVVLAIPFVSIYIHTNDGINYLLPSVAICFAMRTFFTAIRTPSVTLINAKGLFKENKMANIFEAIANIILAIAFVQIWGIAGVLLAGVLSSAVRSIFYIIFIERKLEKNRIKKSFFMLIFYIFFGIISYLLLSNFTVSNWWQWFIQAIYRTTIISISLFLFVCCTSFSEVKYGFGKIKTFLIKD